MDKKMRDIDKELIDISPEVKKVLDNLIDIVHDLVVELKK